MPAKRQPNTEYRYAIKVFLEDRDGFGCQICFKPLGKTFDIDHIWPVAQGGPSTLDNFRLTHRRCNRARARSYDDGF